MRVPGEPHRHTFRSPSRTGGARAGMARLRSPTVPSRRGAVARLRSDGVPRWAAAGGMSMIFVIGATGKVGRHVVSGLLELDVPVRALAHQSDAAGLPGAVDVVSGDLADPQGLAGHLDGVEAAFLVWPFFGADGAEEVVATLA